MNKILNLVFQFITKYWWGLLIAIIALWWSGSQLPMSQSERDKKPFELDNSDWVLGARDNGIQVIEYSDIQCPACKFYKDAGKTLVERFGNKIVFGYRHFPLRQIHPHANQMAQAAEVAGKYNKFFEFVDSAFNSQESWSGLGSVNNTIKTIFESIGIGDKYSEVSSKTIKGLVEADYLTALAAGVDSTPTFVVNGQKLNNIRGIDDLVNRVELAINDATKGGSQKAN